VNLSKKKMRRRRKMRRKRRRWLHRLTILQVKR
jgi:hypothetical protein